jgi:amidase
MLDATHGPEPGAPYTIAAPERPFAQEVGTEPGRLRIAWTTHPLMGSAAPHPDCVDAVTGAIELLAQLGHTVTETTPRFDGAAFSRAFMYMVAGEVGAELDDLAIALGRPPRRPELEPLTWALGLVAKAVSARELASALRLLERSGKEVGRFFTDWDILVTPTVATPPPKIGALPPTRFEHLQLRLVSALGSGRLIKAGRLLEQIAASAFEFLPWTAVFNIGGQPAMSVPLHWNAAGLPVGVHFVARTGDEATLLRLAGQLEREHPWFDRLPEIPRRRT